MPLLNPDFILPLIDFKKLLKDGNMLLKILKINHKEIKLMKKLLNY